MQRLITLVDKIYCINLDSRPDRWELVQREFESAGILQHVNRMPGQIGETPREGCLQSHVNCISEANNQAYENVLIFEDDANFLKRQVLWLEEISNFLQNNRNWDLFYLGGNVIYPAFYVGKHIFKAKFLSAHAYIVNKRAYAKALQSLPPIDVFYSRNMRSYGITPPIVAQGKSYSDIRREFVAHKEKAILKKYQKLVTPNIAMRWFNYIRMHYFK